MTYKEHLSNTERIASKTKTLYKTSHAIQLEDDLVDVNAGSDK